MAPILAGQPGKICGVLRREEGIHPGSAYRLSEFLFGCAGQYVSAIRAAANNDGSVDLHFDGETFSRAAITRLEKVISAVEVRSGIPRASVGNFATHQSNPRLLALLAKRCGVSADTFPPLCRTSGNLGSSMCGAALHAALLEEVGLGPRD